MKRGGNGIGALVICCGLGVLLGSCTTVPDTGRAQLTVISPQEEAEMGLQAFESYRKVKTAAAGHPRAAQVQTVGRRIASVVSVPEARWEFVLFADAEPNAFALPGGKVGVNTGIFAVARDAEGLAAVMSHEIAHVVARHAGERLTQRSLAALGGSLLGAVLGQESGAVLAEGAYGLGAEAGMLRYSRTHEYEADQLGALYMARAGYDPRAAVRFWRDFAEYNRSRGGSEGGLEFFRSHPLDENRIRALEAFMPRALAEWEKDVSGS